MTITETSSRLVASEANVTTAVSTERQESGPVFSSPFRVWVRLLQAFDYMLVQPTTCHSSRAESIRASRSASRWPRKQSYREV